jgi:hypothetical protein
VRDLLPGTGQCQTQPSKTTQRTRH